MAELITLPEGAPLENRHVSQLIDAALGVANFGIRWRLTALADASNFAVTVKNGITPGKHLQILHSSGAPVLFEVTDAGLFAGTTAITFLNEVRGFYGNAAAVPTGWTILGQNTFVYGANADGEVGATGGAATHTHSHTHTSAAHAHSHLHTMDTRHAHSGDTGLNQSPPHSVTDDGSSQTNVADDGDHSHPINESGSATDATSTDSQTTTPGATGSDATAGSSLPPYTRWYHIRRTA